MFELARRQRSATLIYLAVGISLTGLGAHVNLDPHWYRDPPSRKPAIRISLKFGIVKFAKKQIRDKGDSIRFV